jgi:hypothetical protein
MTERCGNRMTGGAGLGRVVVQVAHQTIRHLARAESEQERGHRRDRAFVSVVADLTTRVAR